MKAHFSTADVYDARPDESHSCETQFVQYGARRSFSGRIRTVKCEDDNVLVRRALESPGSGAVLVVDGGGSLRSALLGDIIAELGRKNGWAGIVVFGAIRDAPVLAKIDFGVKALGSNPKKSGKRGTGQSDVEIAFGGVTFAPGHWLYSDDDGVIVMKDEFVAGQSPGAGSGS